MAEKKPKSDPKKKQKPGPEAERLKVRGDPIAAFDRLVKAPPPKPKPSRKK